MQRIPLFDLGNVVVKVDFQPFLAWLAGRSAGSDLEGARRLLRSSLWYDFEFGNISRADFARRLRALYRADFTQAELEERFCAIFPGPVEGIEELLRELAGRGPIYALSNTNEVHLEWLNRELPGLMGRFTKIFASHEMRARKPYPGIYRGVASELGVPPAGLLFFDDLEANVLGARRAGLEAHLFLETGPARDWLRGFEGNEEIPGPGR